MCLSLSTLSTYLLLQVKCTLLLHNSFPKLPVPGTDLSSYWEVGISWLLF